jgi:glyoxalase family protein
MENKIRGFHHITAIASEAQRNYKFYTDILGQRLVKKTVNFDDPGTYHFYYGNEIGTPGTILTFFPWEGARQGSTGSGMATEIAYNVPAGSFEFWTERFRRFNIKNDAAAERFDEQVLPFEDPDGLKLLLVVPRSEDKREPWETTEVKKDVATRGFHSVTLTLRNIVATTRVLTDVLGFELKGQEKNRHRFMVQTADHANIVDLVEEAYKAPGINSAGTVHHIAFRVKDENDLMEMREKVLSRGYSITNKIDRNYFFSLYFREPGGVLFEIATDNPGFAIDEPVNELGTHLKLPAQYEDSRKEIEGVLPVLSVQ